MHIIIGVIIGAVIGEAIIKRKELKRILEDLRSPSRRMRKKAEVWMRAFHEGMKEAEKRRE